MRFWDTSALVPLVFLERETPRVERWVREDPRIVVWTLTRAELLSALARRRRENPGATARLHAARREVISAWERWSEVTEIEVVRRHAERLVETHPIRAAEALQIGAALVVAGDHPSSLPFVTLDRTQAVAAEREGFPVLGVE